MGKGISSRKDSELISVVVLTFDKVDFKSKLFRRDENYHILVTKGTIHQEDFIILIAMYWSWAH